MTTYAYNRYFKQELPIVACYNNAQNVIYADLLKPFAKTLKARIKAHRQNVVLAEGPTGSGKSTVLVNLALEINADWDINSNYVYSVDDFKRKLKEPLKSDPVSLIDEGSVALNSMNSQRKDDVLLTVAFDTLRSFGLTTLIAIPNKRHINKRIIENHVNFLIKCPVTSPLPGYDPRGFATIYVHEFRDWGLDYWRPIGTTLFNRMASKVADDYEQIKLKHQLQFLESFTEGIE